MDARRSPDEAWSDARHLWDDADEMESYDVVVVGGGHNGLTCAVLPREGGQAGPGAGGARRGRRRLRDEGGRGAGLPAQLPLELPRDHPHGPRLPRTWSSSATERRTSGRRTSSATSSPTDGRWSCARRPRTRPVRTDRPVLGGAMQRRSATSRTSTCEVLDDGFIPAMFSPARAAVERDLRPLEGWVGGARAGPAVPVDAEPRCARVCSSRPRCRRGSGSGSRSSPGPATSSAWARTTR